MSPLTSKKVFVMSNMTDKKPVQLCKLSDLTVGETCRIYATDSETTHWLPMRGSKPFAIKAGIYQKVHIGIRNFEYRLPYSYQSFCHIKTGQVMMLPTHCPCEKIMIEMKTSQAY